MEDLTHRIRQAADLVRDLAREAQETTGWSANLSEAKDLTDAACALRSAGDVAYLRAVKLQDDRERAACPAGRGRNSTADSLVFRYHLDRSQALRDVAAARALDTVSGTLPAFAEELLEGRLTRGHVDAAIRIVEAIPASVRDRVVDTSDQDTNSTDDGTDENGPVPMTVGQVAEAFLLAASASKPPRAVSADGQELLARLDPATADGRDPGADARRSLTYLLGSDGCLHLRVVVPPLDAPQMKALVQAFGKPTPKKTDEQHDEQHDEQQGDRQQELRIPDERTLPARRYDVFAATLFAGATQAGGAGTVPGDSTRVIVTATPEQVAAAEATQQQAPPPQENAPTHEDPEQQEAEQEQESATPPAAAAGLAMVDGFGPIPPVVLAYLLCGSRMTRVLLSPGGQVLDVGRDVRDATTAQRKALTARDRGCLVPSCDQGAGACHPHHLVEWQHGGPTALSNLLLLCPRHHREVHLDIWKVVIHDGLPHVIPPRWLDPDQTPRRNTDHQISDHARTVGDQLRLALNRPQPTRPTTPETAQSNTARNTE